MSFTLSLYCTCADAARLPSFCYGLLPVDARCPIHSAEDEATFDRDCYFACMDAVAKVREKWDAKNRARHEWEASG